MDEGPKEVPAAALQQDRLWSQLMVLAQDGDHRAYEALLRAIVPFIRVLASRHRGTEGLLEDVVQDVLLSMHRVRHTYDPRRPFTPWLASITNRRAIDAIRRRSRIAAHETSDDTLYEFTSEHDGTAEHETSAADTANKEVELEDVVSQLEALVSQLPQRQREAIELVRLKEMSLAEASAVSGQSVGALKVSVHRALKALQAKVKGGRWS